MKLMVLDGNSIVNRAYYGIRPLSTAEGVPTNAVYGFLAILQRLVDEDAPDALCVTFDLPAPTFRHTECDFYKAQRKPMPDELAQQMPILKQVLDAMSIPRFELEGFEADDLIGTIGESCRRAGWDCVAVTGDRDALQLVTDTMFVKLVSTYGGKSTTTLYTPQTFFEKYGFIPERLVDLKALMGDASDNIPGVAGVGEKTATDLVRRYGTIENIYADPDAVEAKPAVKAKLAAGRQSAEQSKWLATIVKNAPIDFHPEGCLRKAVKPELYDLFLKLEFLKFIEKFGLRPPEGTAKPADSAPPKAVPVESARQAAELLSECEAAEYVSVLALPGFDTLCVCLKNTAYIFAEGSQPEGYGDFLREFFSDRVKKVSHEIKDLIRALLDEGLPAGGFIFDVSLAAYLLSSTDSSYPLKKLSARYLGSELPDPAAFSASDAVSPLSDRAAAFSALAAHAAALGRLYELFAPRLLELDEARLYNDVELPLCRVLAEMERAGCLVDRRALTEYGEALSLRIAETEKSVWAHAGREFNINSPKQLGEVLFTELGLHAGKKTKTGYSTNVEVLEKLRGEHPVINEILLYRTLTKLKSTYADGLLRCIARDGRIHSDFKMTVTATGRLSSTEPNLQNIPTRTELGAEIRKMFVASPGCVLVDADYSQIELRLLAHIAGDERMLRAFREGEDIHAVTASQVFGVPQELVTPEMRRSAKAVNFGIVYGISEFSLSQDIGVPVYMAKEYMANYFAKYSGVRKYMDDIIKTAKAQGYVSTIMNRRRDLPELSSTNYNTRSFGERVALNMPIQGSAADIMKLAMVRVADRLRAEGLSARLILQVHDELIVEAPENERERVERLLAEEMQGAAALSVPLIAEAASGGNWLEAKK